MRIVHSRTVVVLLVLAVSLVGFAGPAAAAPLKDGSGDDVGVMPGDNVGVMPGDNTRMPIEDVFLQAKKAFSDHVPKGSALQAKQIVFS